MSIDDDGMDLVTPIPRKILESQAPPSGQSYLLESGGLLSPFHFDPDLFMGERVSKRLRAEQGWFEKLVVHAPSVGSFYEDALRSIIQELLPSRYKAGTGFVFDADRRKSSKQMDILIYDDFDEAPLYKRGEFVVISPAAVVSISEVKKRLQIGHVKEIVRSTFISNLGTHPSCVVKCNYLNVFSYSSAAKINRVFETLVASLKQETNDFVWRTKSGAEAHFSPTSIVLPSFFFLNDHNYIESRLVPVKNTYSWDISVAQFEAPAKDGLNEYLAAAIDLCRGKKTDLQERNFRTLPIRSVSREEMVGADFRFFKRYAMLDLLDHFPQEADRIRNFRIDGLRPYAFVLPASISLSSIASFRDLCSSDGIDWEARNLEASKR